MKVRVTCYLHHVWRFERDIDVESIDRNVVKKATEAEIFRIDTSPGCGCPDSEDYVEITDVQPLDTPDEIIIQHAESLAGKVIYVKGVYAFAGDDSDYYGMEPPLAVRIRRPSDGKELISDHGDWIDSNYDVDPLDPDDPRLAGLRSFWIAGLCIRMDDEPGIFDVGDIVYPSPSAGEEQGLRERIRAALTMKSDAKVKG